ncbi:MAG: RecQ family ATP-dependent DNA helicase [Bacteroidales bacterium]|nr:RecQ family ATP-dependent DNA helicase [Bacteroidales bacterium]MBN2699515.1 RecQ family ATP-dependent DNA helicase [Bacteroidales bacterium]
MRTCHQILSDYWGYTEFRPLQEDIIRSVLEGKDTLALMPTGGGKSITFQVPAMAREGICLVVTPLIALMKDQVENLKKRGIKAIAVHSGLSREEMDVSLDNCIYGDFKFLYVSPERIDTELFKVRVQQMKVNLIAIDEAHCISQWGYDFRPSYLKIAGLRALLPGIPLLALTATATPEVAQDIQDKLGFSQKNVLRTSFERKNLVYLVRRTEKKEQALLSLVGEMEGSGIVYVRNRKKCREYAELLSDHGMNAGHYHAGLKHEERTGKQELWTRDGIRVMVATNAFGMGIDKPDVRFVIHMDLPDNPESYFQEAGRAGRDGNPARAILVFSPVDERLIQNRIAVNFPGIPKIREVYNALGNYLQVPVGSGKMQSYDFDFGGFLARYRLNALVAHSSLEVLMREGYVDVTDEINNPSRVHFRITRDELYRFQVKNEKFDGFIKLLLRSYTGMFSQFVNIDEGTLARRSGLSGEGIYNFLKNLSRMQIITYVPRKRTPVVTYLEERLDERNLHISPERYKFRKERYAKKIGEMLRYAKSESVCRSQFLLSYFGELDAPRCGQCDVCTKNINGDLKPDEFDRIAETIRMLLMERDMTVPELTKRSGVPSERLLRVLERLLDQDRLRRNEQLMFQWNKRKGL